MAPPLPTSGSMTTSRASGRTQKKFDSSAMLAPAKFAEAPVSLPLVGVAGLLVGFGTRLGNGCTSGHGICGMSRLSARSLAAVFTFMATGALVVFLARHVLGGNP